MTVALANLEAAAFGVLRDASSLTPTQAFRPR